ncbi:hypothetical protein LTR36_008382 [Oleoguttula mirabilis]|uniref:AB hydrolase-1 domain-containing protein n=1 Tax=Oleoguttula mirabilis TaxID=1507867 RepID=A0AAV9J7Y1_9PEZI|nr:hypothetical protein LTR36_008382 [Oleoguttula mirabilis]
MADATLATIVPFLQAHETKASSGGIVKSYSHDTGSGPVLCMVHGYPQSAYMWRHVVPMLKDKVTMFLPELPGYGLSSLPPKPDKRTVGNILVEALQEVFGKDRPVIWCGHDRGGRVGHCLLVDNDPKTNIKAAILLDIVPTLEQWRSFSNPAAAVAYYHWPFLATPMAPQLIEGMGGGNYCKNNFIRSQGKNAAGVAKFKEDDAIAHYCHLFNQPETISGSCADYASAAGDEVKEQEADQKAGKKVKAPTLIIYSANNLGRMHDVDAEWPKWVDGELKCVGVADGIGHYIPEEAPDQVAKLILEWVDKYSK